MDRTIAIQNGKTIPIPKNVNKIQVQAIRKGGAVMVPFKGVV